MLEVDSVFNAQIEPFLSEYPNFKKKTVNDVYYLKGILDIPNDEGEIAGNFSVEIYPTKDFPYAFPTLYEVGNEIPCEADWHKYQNGSCCMTVPAEEKLMCKKGITLVWFVQNVAIPYFANQLHKKQTGHYLQEYSHGSEGIYEFYLRLFKSDDLKVWKKCLENVFRGMKLQRNEMCYCNSGKKYKNCHLSIESDIGAIGRKQIIYDFKILGLI